MKSSIVSLVLFKCFFNFFFFSLLQSLLLSSSFMWLFVYNQLVPKSFPSPFRSGNITNSFDWTTYFAWSEVVSAFYRCGRARSAFLHLPITETGSYDQHDDHAHWNCDYSRRVPYSISPTHWRLRNCFTFRTDGCQANSRTYTRMNQTYLSLHLKWIPSFPPALLQKTFKPFS